MGKHVYVAAAALCLVLAIAIAASNAPVYNKEEPGGVAGGVCPQLQDGQAYKQVVDGYGEGLSGLYLLPATYGRRLESGSLEFALLDGAGRAVQQTQLNCADILDNRYLYIPVEQQMSGAFTLQIKAEGLGKGDELSFWLSESELLPLETGEEELEYPLFMQLELREYKSRWQSGYIFLVMAFVLLACWPLAGGKEPANA